MVAIGLSGGGLAYAASSGGAPTLAPAHAHARAINLPVQPGGPVLMPAGKKCSGPTLSPVHGVKAPKFTMAKAKAEGRVRVHVRPVACSRGKTSGGPILTPVGGPCPRLSLVPAHGVKGPKLSKAEAPRRGHGRLIVCSAGKTTSR